MNHSGGYILKCGLSCSKPSASKMPVLVRPRASPALSADRVDAVGEQQADISIGISPQSIVFLSQAQ